MQGFKPGSKPKDKDKGGKIEGPGTGTSDSIKAEIPKGAYIMPADSTQKIGEQALSDLGKPVPVNVSNGEYQMPPEQVHAVGVQALNQMRDATHTPVAAGFSPQEGGLYFANGGAVESTDDLIARISAKYGTGAGSAPVQQPEPEQPQQKPAQPVSASPSIGSAIEALRNNKRQIKEAIGFVNGGSPSEDERRLPASMLGVSYGDMTGRPGNAPAPQPEQPQSPATSVSYSDMQRAPNVPQPSEPSPARPIDTTTPSAQPAEQSAPKPQTAPQTPPATFTDMQREPSISRTGEPRQMPQGEPLGLKDLPQGTTPPAPPAPPQGAQFGDLQREPSIPRTGEPRQMPQGEPVSVRDLAQGFRAGGQAVTEQIAGAGPAAANQVAGAGRAVASGATEAAAGFRAGGQEATNQIAATGGSLAQAAGSALGQAFPNTITAVRGAGENIGEAYQAGGIPAAAGATVRNTLVPAIGFAADVARGAKTVLDPAANALKTAVTGDPTPIEGTVQAAARTAPPVTPAAPAPAQKPAQQAAAQPPAAQPQAGTTPQPDPRAMGPAPGMTVKPTAAPGISRIDNAPGLNSPLFTNLPAGQAVSEMQGGAPSWAPMASQAAQTAQAPQAAGFVGQQSRSSDAERTRRAAEIMAETARIRQNRADGRPDNWTPSKPISDAQMSALQNRNMALKKAESALFFGRTDEAKMHMEVAAMHEANLNGARKQESDERQTLMRDEGETNRNRSRNDVDMERVAVERRRAESEAEVRGFEARGLQRVEKLYAALENATTPEERASIAEQIRAINGKEAPNRFTVVPGGQEISPQGMPYTRPSMVFNNQTGQFVEQQPTQQSGAAQAPQGERQKSAIYTDANGNRARWDGSKFVPVN